MTTISYPSDRTPGPVPVSVDVPDGWLVEPAPDVAFVAASPEETDGVHVNAVVAVRRVPAGTTAAELAAALAEDAGDLEGVTVSEVTPVRLGDRDGALLTVTFSDPAAAEVVASETVRQLQAVCVVPVAEHVADAVSVSVTYPGSADAEQVRGYEELVGSLRAG